MDTEKPPPNNDAEPVRPASKGCCSMAADPGQTSVTNALRDRQVTASLPKPFDVDQLVREIRAAA